MSTIPETAAPRPSTAPTRLLSERFGPFLPLQPLLGFIVAALAVLLSCTLSFYSLNSRTTSYERIRNIRAVQTELNATLSALQDAEAGQRGYLLTDDVTYLHPYDEARNSVYGHLENLRRFDLTRANTKRMETLSASITAKLVELSETIQAQRAGNVEQALSIVRSNRGREAMDRARALIAEINADKQLLLAGQEQEWQNAALLSFLVTGGGSLLLLVLIALAAHLTSRQMRAAALEAWLKAGVFALTERTQGDPRIETLSEHIVGYVGQYVGARIGAMYTLEQGQLRRQAGYALPSGFNPAAQTIALGEGLTGQAARDNRVCVATVPDDYFAVSSSLGQARPRQILIVPVAVNRSRVNAVIEFGFFREVHDSDVELLRRSAESIAVAVEAAMARSRLEELLQETQRQSEELQTQQEELRVANEELEEQTRRLQDSQARMESQHAELEQINTQLEEQAHMLENQKDELTRAQTDLTGYANEVSRAYKYKTEFLANMSHELRTPLNSSLILAKLLADNKSGNLTDEQVNFARTILSAGNDLLDLINDILDLSKIEAGKIEIQREAITLRSLLDGLQQSFGAVARQKGLRFECTAAPDAPGRITTDSHRLSQILRNLISNAVKFTETGEIELRVERGGAGEIEFRLRDTGIGIPAAQLDAIFEAFHQADGSTHRKYGGTGLGLSISRQLARLLGGDIQVHSEVGIGSTFTLRLPIDASIGEGTAAPVVPVSVSIPPVRPAAPRMPVRVEPPKRNSVPAPAELPGDDRHAIGPDSRVLLVIEDDVAFAGVLRDLAHEMGFRAILAHDARTGLAAARAHPVHAIVLDMNLPDRSGLEVLDEIKREPMTRHIPIHVVSVEDYSQEALSRGAIGYALKPVLRERLTEALQKLEHRLTQRLRRVLVVEDDARQRDSIRALLARDGVEITDAATANAALATLQQATFDCMVLDLNLPDLSGYELLEQMASSEKLAFPPVIVYTGRSLTRDEEQNLRRFSKAIIIKDARSPERLLDEVSLFLHQVESTLPPERQRQLRELRDREAAFENRRILIVEDDVRNIFALSKVLEPKGAHVVIARNGREALARLETAANDPGQNIDLVLMDIMMPEMDGLTAMREIRKNTAWKRLPIIALTAKAMKDDREQCLQAGANDYIAKPLDIERLLSLVRVWMPQ